MKGMLERVLVEVSDARSRVHVLSLESDEDDVVDNLSMLSNQPRFPCFSIYERFHHTVELIHLTHK